MTPVKQRSPRTHTPLIQLSPLATRSGPNRSPLDLTTRSYVNSLPRLLTTITSAPHPNADDEALARKEKRKRQREEEEKKDEQLEETLKASIPGWSGMDQYDKHLLKAKERSKWDE